MRKSIRRGTSVALTGGMLTVLAVFGAPAASAVPPGQGFISPRFGMGCVAGSDANGNGFLTCSGLGGFWQARVSCNFSLFPDSLGTNVDNFDGGTHTSTTNSGCLFGVSNIDIVEKP